MRSSKPRRIPIEYDREIAKIARDEGMSYAAAFRQWQKKMKGLRKQWENY